MNDDCRRHWAPAPPSTYGECWVTGLDIMHGELKNLMLIAEQELTLAQETEEESGEAIDSMERKYWEGVLDTYGELYKLTYDLSFAIGAKNE
jgi:hypothetical protein